MAQIKVRVKIAHRIKVLEEALGEWNDDLKVLITDLQEIQQAISEERFASADSLLSELIVNWGGEPPEKKEESHSFLKVGLRTICVPNGEDNE